MKNWDAKPKSVGRVLSAECMWKLQASKHQHPEKLQTPSFNIQCADIRVCFLVGLKILLELKTYVFSYPTSSFWWRRLVFVVRASWPARLIAVNDGKYR